MSAVAMACNYISWPIMGSLDKDTIKNIANVFVFDHGDNCIYITHDGDVYAFGRNGKRAPLGIVSRDFIREPKRITEIEDESEAYSAV